MMALSACVTASRPNVPFPNPVPQLRSLESENPLLAKELRKLPEILDGLNEKERTALERICELHRTQPSQLDAAFNDMYAVGLPGHRAYCSPLQALLWIAMERPLSQGSPSLAPFNLIGLLKEAWTFAPRIGPDLLRTLVSGIKDAEIRKKYEKDIHENPAYVVTTFTAHVRFSPALFEDWVHEKLEEIANSDPWRDYDTVLERLNAPELVDDYVKRQIGYSNYWEIPGYSPHNGDARYVFRHKAGDCLYISEFIAQALRKNGYSAWVEKKPPLRACDAWHAVCVFRHQGRRYIIDDGKRSKQGIMPYDAY